MDEAIVTRQMPSSIEAEASVVGSMMLDRQAILTASEQLTQEDFYYGNYGIMFQTIVDMNNEGKPVDIVTLQERLKEKDAPPQVYDLDFIRNLIASVPTSANIRHYAGIVKDKALLRSVIRTTEGIANDCYAGNDKTEDILAETEKRIFDLVKNKGDHEYTSIDKVVLEALDRISEAAKNRGSVTGVPTGFKDLDRYLSGMQPSDFILVAARPSMGKTAFVLNVAEHVAIKEGVTTAIFSLEMSDVQLVNRMLSLESTVDADKIRRGNLDSGDWGKLIEGADSIAKSHLIIDDTPNISISELRSKCRKYKLEHNLGLIIIDYLQLMSGNGKTESRQQEISDISRSLKALARELNVPVVTLSQLSRAVEQRPDHRPMLSDLRESGAIEQDADVVMFLYRDDYYNKDTEFPGVAEIIIAKQRNGPIGTVKMAWLPEQTRFADLLKDER
ncbi:MULTISPECIES: replicative DNA helicase [Lachnospira]|jgi:replicative DNA helicase|uniref:Replicative DNA helicase n=2 Tax=Lachnospira TaxID=28050 RepID=A0A1H5SPS4_9FIRM|nr:MULTISPECIES: replicative DNA helicase [Lachnospira]MBQ2472754.1 replicative DNA helicase [Lachnospira sp.]MCR5516119.1 replicative DNA helicase [Lachnospira sp.]SDN00789.1 primary replicative DNA helicase [Lachnospira pectinoschiza]SEF51767.1 primary replicative DNA helicase [Lachnospira multipara]